jgi:hypothetical protein
MELQTDVRQHLQKYTAIWQTDDASEMPWVNELYGSFIERHVFDGQRSMIFEHTILFDHFIPANDLAYYEKFKGRDAFLVDFSDENYEFDATIYANFKGVIRCHWSNIFQSQYVKVLPLGYSKNLSKTSATFKLASERQFAWSFTGQVNKSSRCDMANKLSKVEPHLLFATDDPPGIIMWNHNLAGRRCYSPTENTEILLDSVFSPCPMGNVNLECFRIYEALECGSIPIIEKRLTLDYFAGLLGNHPLPVVRSWKEGQRYVGTMLKSPELLNQIQRDCTTWWASRKQQCSEEIGEFLQRCALREEALTINAIVTARYGFAGWNLIELLRHHDRHALLKRITRQFNRFAKTGTFRLATRRLKS